MDWPAANNQLGHCNGVLVDPSIQQYMQRCAGGTADGCPCPVATGLFADSGPMPAAPEQPQLLHWNDDQAFVSTLHSSVLDDMIAEDLEDQCRHSFGTASKGDSSTPDLFVHQHQQQPQQPEVYLGHGDVYSMASSGAIHGWCDNNAHPMSSAGAVLVHQPTHAAAGLCGSSSVGSPRGTADPPAHATGLELIDAAAVAAPADRLPDIKTKLAPAGSPTTSSAMTAGFSSGFCSSSRNAGPTKRKRMSEELDEDYMAPAVGSAAAAGNSKARPKQQRISWQRHVQELQHLEQRVSTLTTSNEDLQKKVKSLNDTKADLLTRLTGLTSQWRGTVAANDQLQRQTLTQEIEIAMLKHQLATLRQQQQVVATAPVTAATHGAS